MANEDTAIVQKPREPFDLEKLQLEIEFERFLEHPLTQAMEAVTGAFALGAKHAGIAAGRIAQAILKGQMYEQCAEEWRVLREAGKIPDNLGEKKHGLQTWAELMKIIDDECPDEERLEALKAAFYAVNKVNQSDAEQIVQYQLWQIAKELRSGDVLLLRSLYQHINNPPGEHYREWLAGMAKWSGLIVLELVERYEKHLSELLLIAARVNVAGDSQRGYSGSGINAVSNRLTSLGIRCCQNIETYESDLQGARKR